MNQLDDIARPHRSCILVEGCSSHICPDGNLVECSRHERRHRGSAADLPLLVGPLLLLQVKLCTGPAFRLISLHVQLGIEPHGKTSAVALKSSRIPARRLCHISSVTLKLTPSGIAIRREACQSQKVWRYSGYPPLIAYRYRHVSFRPRDALLYTSIWCYRSPP